MRLTGQGTQRSMNLVRAHAGKRTRGAVVRRRGATPFSDMPYPGGGGTGQTQGGIATEEERKREIHQKNPEKGHPHPAAHHVLYL